jgi:hypothetical protein
MAHRRLKAPREFVVQKARVTKLLRITPDGVESPIFVAHDGWIGEDRTSLVPLETVQGWIGGQLGWTSCLYEGKHRTMMFVEDAAVNGHSYEFNEIATRLRLDWTTSLARQEIEDYDERVKFDPDVARLAEVDRQLNQMEGTVLVELEAETWTKIIIRKRSLAEVRSVIAHLGTFEDRFAHGNADGFLVEHSHSVEVYTTSQAVQSVLTVAFR